MLKKFSGLSILTGSVILLSGCKTVPRASEDVVEPDMTTYSDGTNSTNNSGSVVNCINNTVTTVVVPNNSVVTTTTTAVSNDIISEPSVTTSPVNNQEELFAYAGYGYRKYLEELYDVSDSCDAFNYNSDSYKYRYVDGYQNYLVQEGDTVNSICEKFNITYDQFLGCNPMVTDDSCLKCGQVRFPVKYEMYQFTSGQSIDQVSIDTGVPSEDLALLNPLDENGTFGDVSEVVTHVFVGNDTKYKNYNGLDVNCVYDNRICGSILYGQGFAGASQFVLAMIDDPYSYGRNDVILYHFDGDNGIDCTKRICCNAKGISNAYEGLFNVELRTDDDILELLAEVNMSFDDIYDYMQYASRNYNPDYVEYDEAGNIYISLGSNISDYQKVK